MSTSISSVSSSAASSRRPSAPPARPAGAAGRAVRAARAAATWKEPSSGSSASSTVDGTVGSPSSACSPATGAAGAPPGGRARRDHGRVGGRARASPPPAGTDRRAATARRRCDRCRPPRPPIARRAAPRPRGCGPSCRVGAHVVAADLAPPFDQHDAELAVPGEAVVDQLRGSAARTRGAGGSAPGRAPCRAGTSGSGSRRHTATAPQVGLRHPVLRSAPRLLAVRSLLGAHGLQGGPWG